MIEPSGKPMTSEPADTQSDLAPQQLGRPTEPPLHPPAAIDGYTFRSFIGSGAHGQVWEAVDQNTGRLVAVKFYTHQGGLDWPLLSKEVEKLVFLSADRYVVQLLDVGWASAPPYYVMEYMPNGSLADRLHREGAFSVGEAVEIFREIVVGISHAHSKGVLHCDLKPANLLLDQDGKPRLADFGQSRLSHEQSPALGTLFYMAPEQADLQAVPDTGWDVYAVGALLYCMLTGQPPYRSQVALSEIDSTAGLEKRLVKYRSHIRSAPRPVAHRQIMGVDRALEEIIDRCLETDPKRRFMHVINVLNALDERERLHRRRPLLVLGLLGPLLLMITMGIFGFRGYQRAVRQSEMLVTERVRESNGFAAQYVAETVAGDLEDRLRIVYETSVSPELIGHLEDCLENEEVADYLQQFASSTLSDEDRETLRAKYVQHPCYQSLLEFLESRMHPTPENPSAASWFVQDYRGTNMATVFVKQPENLPVGGNFAWRTYYHGGDQDLLGDERPKTMIKELHLSSVFQSTSTGTWKIAISAPLRDQESNPIGVIALTLELGKIAPFKRTARHFAVLVDAREGDHRGVILQHPLYDELLHENRKLPDFNGYLVDVDRVVHDNTRPYTDPLSASERGAAYQGDWVVGVERVRLNRPNPSNGDAVIETGMLVLAQEALQDSLAPVANLGPVIIREGINALIVVISVSALLWVFVYHLMKQSKHMAGRNGNDDDLSSIHSRETIELRQSAKRD